VEIRVSLLLQFTVKRQKPTNELINYSLATDSVIEMHAFLVTLVRQFDFFLPENGQEIKTIRVGMITPLVVGEEQKGPQIPLKVAFLGNE
jgi:hypothetical protein